MKSVIVSLMVFGCAGAPEALPSSDACQSYHVEEPSAMPTPRTWTGRDGDRDVTIMPTEDYVRLQAAVEALIENRSEAQIVIDACRGDNTYSGS